MQHSRVTDELKESWNARVRETFSNPQRRELTDDGKPLDLVVEVSVTGENAEELCKSKSIQCSISHFHREILDMIILSLPSNFF